ncbi:MAG: hypothetical protein J6V01_05620 [Clostridia bacterium]|nr:hypothetical protein [Clostridia bacterium]
MTDHTEIKAQTKSAILKYVLNSTGRKPMVLPIIMEV